MRYVLASLMAGCLAASLVAVELVGDQGKSTSDVANKQAGSVWMQRKMDYAQAILRGLAMGDFEAIRVNGAQMYLLNKVEGFARSQDRAYQLQLRSFEKICDEIVEQATRENLAGVTLAFNQLTVNCVNCHRSLRQDASKSHTQPSKAPRGPIRRGNEVN